jgi:hypothetical protein
MFRNSYINSTDGRSARNQNHRTPKSTEIQSFQGSGSARVCMVRSLVLFGLCAILTANMLLAQSGGATSTLVGTVTDATGAAVVGATVSITETGTNTTQVTTTSSSGTYAVASLKPATYQVTASMAGFSTSVAKGVVLAVGQEQRLDMKLATGAVTETVNVKTDTTNLDTDNAAIGQVVTQKEIVDLPLNGRNFTQLLLLNSGAVQNTGEQGAYRANEGNALSIQGARPSSNQYFLDGISINDTYYQTPAVVPSIDALQEFQEQTKGYSAAYGGGANQINLNTRSGTNQLHGTAFDFLRNNALDARSYFDVGSIPPLRQNQFGYTLGGPIFIPKLYDGRNKSFFLANYEGQRTTTSQSLFANVPTAAELSGLFPASEVIVDPVTKVPYPGNQIPQSAFSTFAKAGFSQFPAPNSSLPQGNYFYQLPLPIHSDQQTYRFDQNLSSHDSFFVRYTQTDYVLTTSGGGSFANGDNFLDETSRNLAASWTHSFSPNILNQLRFGWLHEVVELTGVSASSAGYEAFGLQNLYPFSQFTTYPLINFRNNQYSAVGGTDHAPQSYDQPSYSISDALTWSKGSHTVSMGADVRWWTGYNNTFNSPTFTFDGSFTGVPAADGGTEPNTGDPLADYLLGYAALAQSQQPTAFAPTASGANDVLFHFLQVAPWIQDDWKATPKLTINAGLRYDFSPLPYEDQGKTFWIDPTIPGGGLYTASQKIINAGLGGALYQYGGQRYPGKTQRLVFAPRLGLAYRPFSDDKTTFRAGYGVFFDSFETKEAATGGGYPFGLDTSVQFINVANLFPPSPALTPVTSAQLGFEFLTTANIHTPYMQDWQLSVEREIFPGYKAEVDYLGSKGTHLLGRVWENAPTQYDPANPTPVSARVPYPNIGLIIDHFWDFYSNYNALTLKLEHSTRNLSVIAGYTYSHSLDDKSGTTGINADLDYNGPQNEYDFNADYGTSSFDTKHHFVGSFVALLPFGRNQHFMSNANTVENLLVGGWQVNGILTLQTGFPFSIGATDIGFVNQNMSPRADVIGNAYPSGFHKSKDAWFNTAAFGQPPIGAYGDSGRNLIRAPGVENFDASVFKNIPIGERITWQTRLEAFNSLNHTNFGFPNSSLTSPTFGVISSSQPGRIVQVAMKLIW